MQLASLDASRTIADILARWPSATPVFLRNRMACPGCSMARFETLANAVAIYRLDLDSFLVELEDAIRSAETK